MDDDHGITDELRKFTPEINGYKLMRPCDEKELLAIANRIDAALAERYVELPKDADGEYIHEHDKVDWRDHSGTWHKNALVVAVCSDGCYVMDGMVFHVHASDIRHHKHPTVEDVLAELLCEYDRDDFELTELIERYAAKLQLRGDE